MANIEVDLDPYLQQYYLISPSNTELVDLIVFKSLVFLVFDTVDLSSAGFRGGKEGQLPRASTSEGAPHEWFRGTHQMTGDLFLLDDEYYYKKGHPH
jgi:hypothetical protein